MKINKTKIKKRLKNSFFLSKEIKEKLLNNFDNLNQKQFIKLQLFLDKADHKFQQLFSQLPINKKQNFINQINLIYKQLQKKFLQEAEKQDQKKIEEILKQI